MTPRTPPIHIPTPKTTIPTESTIDTRTKGARVQQCAPQWNTTIQDMQASGFHSRDLQLVKTALREGVRIETTSQPDLVSLPNTPAVRRNIALCKERIAYYYDIGALELLTERPELLQPLHVVDRPGRKARMVLDLSRNLNDLIDRESFHMQSIQSAVQLSSPGCFYGKIDISDCFLSFPVHEDSRHYLAFELDGSFYRFKRLPFGLSSAPLWTDRFLQCIDFALHKAGISHVRYCDDFLFIAPSATALREALHTAISILVSHGLVINPDKTEGPSQSIQFLGLGLDSREQVLFVPEDKVQELLRLSGDMNAREFTHKRHLQSLVGKFSFVAAALPGARPFFRKLIDATRGRLSPYAKIQVSAEMREDLSMWSRFLKCWNRRARWTSGEPFVLIHDSSKEGFGFYLGDTPPSFDFAQLPLELRPGRGFAGYFSAPDLALVQHSIQWGELFAIACSLAVYGPFLKDSHVQVLTDNITDMFIIRKQSTACPRLLALLRYIYLTCAHYNIHLTTEHIAGELNTTADHFSRPALHKHNAHYTHPTTNESFDIHFILSSSFQQPTDPSLPPTFSFQPSSLWA